MTRPGIAGTLNSRPDTTYILDFYASAAADPSGFGQGERFLGTGKVITGEDGNGNFEFLLFAPTAPGEVLSVTATDPAGNTSEFSEAIVIQKPGAPGVPPGFDVYTLARPGNATVSRIDTAPELDQRPAAALDFGSAGLRDAAHALSTALPDASSEPTGDDWLSWIPGDVFSR